MTLGSIHGMVMGALALVLGGMLDGAGIWASDGDIHAWAGVGILGHINLGVGTLGVGIHTTTAGDIHTMAADGEDLDTATPSSTTATDMQAIG